MDAAGKTGTAHDASLELGWFAGWAPSQHPKIAFSFLVEGKSGRDVARLALKWLVAQQ